MQCIKIRNVPAPDLTPEITAQIRLVLERFGVHTPDLDLTDTARVVRLLEACGADIYLRATIGSWKDTLTDEEVLQDLKDWLRTPARSSVFRTLLPPK